MHLADEPIARSFENMEDTTPQLDLRAVTFTKVAFCKIILTPTRFGTERNI